MQILPDHPLQEGPSGLANALEKLGMYSGRIPMHTQNPNTSHMFIVNPFSGGKMANLFSTHPPLQERIARLRGKPVDRQNNEGDDDRDRGLREARNTWGRLR